MSEAPAYGLWPLVAINSLVFLVFAFSFARPRTAREWRSFGGFAAWGVGRMAPNLGPGTPAPVPSQRGPAGNTPPPHPPPPMSRTGKGQP